VPAGHTQAEAPIAESRPEGHDAQFDDPAVAWYLPAAHWIQVLARLAPTVVEYVPTAQLVQSEAPAAAEYVPAAQSLQAAAQLVQPGFAKLHVPVKPLRVCELSDVKVTLRKPAVDV